MYACRDVRDGAGVEGLVWVAYLSRAARVVSL